MTSIESKGSAMMSKRERRELERMRLDGYGPTRIAEELELSVNIVKSYIRRHPSLKNAVYCLQCGRAVPQTPGRKRKNFCCNQCRSRFWNTRYRNDDRLNPLYIIFLRSSRQRVFSSMSNSLNMISIASTLASLMRSAINSI